MNKSTAQEKDTDELLHELKRECSIAHFIHENEVHMKNLTLPEYLTEMLKKSGCAKSDVIRASGLDTAYAYHIFSGSKHPSRPKLLALALALGADLKETSRLLHYAGLPQLYARKSWDSIVLFALGHKKSVVETNLLLDKFGERPLLE